MLKDIKRYEAALHAVQSGAATDIGLDNPAMPDYLQKAIKHLRVGIDSAKVEHAALTRLLIERGHFTDPEYVKAIADAMEAEVKRYEALLSERVGSKVTLA